MLACFYGSISILNHIADFVIKQGDNSHRLKSDLLKPYTQNTTGFEAVHLACYIGNVDLLKILHYRFNADWSK